MASGGEPKRIATHPFVAMYDKIKMFVWLPSNSNEVMCHEGDKKEL